jgi:hypothetical protein
LGVFAFMADLGGEGAFSVGVAASEEDPVRDHPCGVFERLAVVGQLDVFVLWRLLLGFAPGTAFLAQGAEGGGVAAGLVEKWPRKSSMWPTPRA